MDTNCWPTTVVPNLTLVVMMALTVKRLPAAIYVLYMHRCVTIKRRGITICSQELSKAPNRKQMRALTHQIGFQAISVWGARAKGTAGRAVGPVTDWTRTRQPTTATAMGATTSHLAVPD